MNALFEPGHIGSLKLKNRMIRSATWEGMCDPDGRPTEKLIQCYTDLAKGGSRENRCRFLIQVYDKIRQVVGKDYPVFIKLNADDNVDNGLQQDDALLASRTLSQKGINAIEVSSGTPGSGKKGPARTKIDSPQKEAYNLGMGLSVKKQVSCPVVSVGGFRSPTVCGQAATENHLDFIAFCRPLIREPDLALRWQSGNLEPAACISCNGCFKPGLFKGGIYCTDKEKKIADGKQ